MNDKRKRINCYNCKHFAITWDPRFPRSCKLYGFSGRELPSSVVLSSTGTECMGFEEKTPRENSQ